MKTATFSPDRVYRYSLWRDWSGIFDTNDSYVLFIGLNPSTADENVDDHTIRRCIGFAQDWGFTKLCMVNLFAFRATKPEDMLACKEPIGEMNDHILHTLSAEAALIVAAWGTLGVHQKRNEYVMQRIKNLHYLKLTKDRHPAHPLYLSKQLKPIAWY